MDGRKRKLRNDILKRRDRIAPEARRAKDGAIKAALLGLPEFGRAGVVLFYASFRSEVNTMEMIDESIKAGKRVLLPKVDAVAERLLIYEVFGTSDLVPGYMGIPEPKGNAESQREPDEADIIIIPGSVFDTSGRRLGYGKGYYDKLLSGMSKKAHAVALAYEEQVAESVPYEGHDVPVDIILTDERVIRRDENQ